MYCPKCGTEMKENEFCSNCFFSFDMIEDPIIQEQREDNLEEDLNINSIPDLDSDTFINFNEEKKKAEDNNFSKPITPPSRQLDINSYQKVENKNIKSLKIIARVVKFIAFSLLAIYLLSVFFINADMVENIGSNIGRIKSVGGKTLEEAYYREKGNFYVVLSDLIRFTGIFFSAVLVALGLK